jgi:hypothetical protein
MPLRFLVLLPIIVGVISGPPPGGPGRVSSGIVADREHSSATYVVDAFEARGLAALESDQGERLVVPRSWLPEGAGEGHVIRVARGGAGARVTLSLELDEAATEERRAAMRERRERLPKGPEGDLDL